MLRICVRGVFEAGVEGEDEDAAAFLTGGVTLPFACTCNCIHPFIQKIGAAGIGEQGGIGGGGVKGRKWMVNK